MLLHIHPDNPSERQISQVVDILRAGGIIIYPTDTIYGMGCDIYNKKAVQRIGQLKGIDVGKSNLSFVCSDLSQMTDFTRHFDKQAYKMLRQYLPGPYTFILEATNKVPKLFQSNKKTVGIRIPDNNICKAIVEGLGNPILSTSLKHDDTLLEYETDPTRIHDKYEKLVDVVIDGGAGGNEPSTVVDMTQQIPTVLREGKGAEAFDIK